MQNSNKMWAAGIALVIVVLVIVALFQRSGSGTSTATTTPISIATSTTQTHDGVTGTGSFTVTGGNTVDIKIPDFRAPIQFSATIQYDVKNALQQAANALETKLAANSFDLESWINLGTVRKMAGDYSGAESAWLFVAKYSPQNSIAFANLGDLYATYLKNYPKAEQAYLTDIKLSPTDESSYLNLYTMYKNFYKQSTTAAEDILKKGIAALPNSVSLHVQLARYYKEKGDTAAAKAQYEAAIAAANASNQTAVAQEIQAEAGN